MAEAEYMDRVDVNEAAHKATCADEVEVLQSLYGPADEAGFYRGEEVSE